MELPWKRWDVGDWTLKCEGLVSYSSCPTLYPYSPGGSRRQVLTRTKLRNPIAFISDPKFDEDCGRRRTEGGSKAIPIAEVVCTEYSIACMSPRRSQLIWVFGHVVGLLEIGQQVLLAS